MLSDQKKKQHSSKESTLPNNSNSEILFSQGGNL